METLPNFVGFVALLGLSIPALLTLSALLAPARAARVATIAFGLTAAFSGTAALLLAGPAAPRAAFGVYIDPATCLMLLLVSGLGVVVVRYSETYLRGEPNVASYRRWLLLTLGAVTSVVLGSSLLVIALGWTATSLALHQLLTFYPERSAALVAAHKKFLVSRLADVCLLGALALLYLNVQSFELERLRSWLDATPELPVSMHGAALLLVAAVALRSAQLPFHGWLIQVMEAPTPVSALLHAGVVNIGGFVLIRVAPWLAHSEPARLACVAIGLVSAVVAALIMTTRISIKVALAWSTCAQMGFLLVQCGLGLWSLALLHLVAHSLYKAHAFLAAGSVVEDWTRSSLREPGVLTPGRVALTTALLVTGALLSANFVHTTTATADAVILSAPILALLGALALVPLLARASGAAATVAGGLAQAAGVVSASALLHVLFGSLASFSAPPASELAWFLCAVGFALLFCVKLSLQLAPQSHFARALHPWLFSGLYLDERFTRLTFRLWPPRLQPKPGKTRSPQSPAILEVQA